jgi:hypothetical protein
MTDRAEPQPISEAQAAVIDRRLEQFGAFMEDAFQRPEIVDEIPDGATLAFHDVAAPTGERVRLTAFRPRRSTRWHVLLADVPPLPHHRFLWVVQPLVAQATWESAEEAFAAIEAVLQRAGEAHLLAG